MYPVSDRWGPALRGSHTVDFKAQLYRRGALLVDDIPVLGGNVVDNATANIRRRCQLNLAPSLEILELLSKNVPVNGGLWPLGNELKLLGGLLYPDGTSEYVPMGLFRLSRAELSRSSSDLIVAVEGWDRGRSVSRASFVEPWHIRQGTNYNDAIRDLVRAKLPFLSDDEIKLAATNYTTPNLVFTGPTDDPWQKAQLMAESLGNELLFNGNGHLVSRGLPSPYSTPAVFVYAEGDDCTMITSTRDLSDEQAYNGVIATGESSSNITPVRAEAWDTDPASPTYFDPKSPETSIYGPVPFFMSSQYITTKAQAVDAAINNLGRVKGTVEAVSFTAINNFAHESYDPVDVTVEKTGIDDSYMLEQLTIGVGVQTAMSAVARKRRVGLAND